MSVRRRALALVLLAALLVTGRTAPTATPVPAAATEATLTATDDSLPPTATPAPPTAIRPSDFSRDEVIADARPFQIMGRFVLPAIREFEGRVRVYER
jgi:hypothetical protein